jgi:hypothetical protein
MTWLVPVPTKLQRFSPVGQLHGWYTSRSDIVLSYSATIDLAVPMKRPLEVHEVMGLALLAGAFVHGVMMGLFHI